MNSKNRKIISSAPGRAGIIGNPTDMYGGLVISCSIERRAKVTLTSNSNLKLIAGDKECEIKTQKDLELKGDHFDIVRATLQHLGLPKEPFQLEFESTIPFRRGLSGSTALIVALAQGILAWKGEYPQKRELAEKARYIEYNHLKIVCGFQDTYMSVFGGFHFMNFTGKQFDQIHESHLFATLEPIEFDKRPLPFVIATTRVKHHSSAVHAPLGERWLKGEVEVVNGYKRIAELTKLGKMAILNSDWPQLDKLMNENHQIQRNLGGSGESNERLIAAALESGAPGAKLAGAGRGGTIIVLWPNEEISQLDHALRQAGVDAVFRPVITHGATLECDARRIE